VTTRHKHPRGRLRWIVPLLVLAIAVPSIGWHWAKAGWRDWHHNYPDTPYGYDQIVNRFGQPCNDHAHEVWMTWVASDNHYPYTFRFHRKLGGYPTEMVTGKGGWSTNLDNDVYGHIQNNHLYPYTKSGIWGYNCRYIRGTTKWSTHAFGIAVDISASYEPMGQCYSTVNKNFAYIFKNHGWRWGLDFCDPMHFQYAFGY
jgi:hypothetical protein